MKTDIKKLENSKVEINIEINSIDFEKEVQQVIKRKKENIIIAGFRKGKAPENIILQEIGEMNILNEAAENMINFSYKKIIKENKIKPLGNPEINIIKIARNNSFIFKTVVSIFPEIELPDYKADNLPKIEKIPLKEVDEKEVEQALDYVRKSRAKLFDKNDSDLAKKGDFVEIEYNDLVDNGKADKKNEDKFLIKDGINLFEKEVIGMKKGENKIIKVKISKDEAEKEVDLRLKSLKRVKLPEIDDSFVKTIGNFTNLEDFKNNIREEIGREKAFLEKQRVCLKFLEQIRKKIEINLPENLIKLEQGKMLLNFKENIEKEMPFVEYLEKIKKTEKEIEESFKREAEIRVVNFLILQKIAKEEKIETTKEDVEKKMNEIIQYYGLKEADINKNQVKAYAEEQIINQKTFDYIYSLYF